MRGCTKEPCVRAVGVPVRSLPSRSALQQSIRKYEEWERALREARRMESENQIRLPAMQERSERVKQREQLLHQANTPRLPFLA